MEFKDRLQHLFDITLINNKPITTYRVGKDTSITRVSLDNYLSGKQSPSIENATIIAQYFNVSTEWLLKGEGNKETDEDSSFISLSREVWNVIKKQADSLASKDKQIEELISLLKKQIVLKEDSAECADVSGSDLVK